MRIWNIRPRDVRHQAVGSSRNLKHLKNIKKSRLLLCVVEIQNKTKPVATCQQPQPVTNNDSRWCEVGASLSWEKKMDRKKQSASLSLKRGICAWSSTSLHLLRLRGGRGRHVIWLSGRRRWKFSTQTLFPSESKSSSLPSHPRTPLTRWRAEAVSRARWDSGSQLPGCHQLQAGLAVAVGGLRGSTCKRCRPREHVCTIQAGAERENNSEMPHFLQDSSN